MAWQHAVFAVIPAELGKKGHRFFGALRDQFVVYPVQRVRESGTLAVHFGREQVAHRDVEGKPVGVEPADQLVAEARVLRLEGVAQNPQRVLVL